MVELGLEREGYDQFLPKQLTEAELRSYVGEIILTEGLNMGKIMGVLKGRFDGRYDGKLASSVVKAALT